MTMLRLKTPLCEILGIEVPVINAGMAEAASVDLTVAVSNAGGLGVLGATMDSPEELREKIRAVRSLTDKPFGVDLLLPANVEMSVQPLSFFADQIPDEHKSYVLELTPAGEIVEKMVSDAVDILSTLPNAFPS